MQINAANVAAVATVMAVIIALLAVVGGGIYQMGELNSRVEQLSRGLEQIPTREEVRILVAEEVSRSNRQLLHALANHEYDADGNVVFTVPLGTEPTGANPRQPAPTQ